MPTAGIDSEVMDYIPVTVAFTFGSHSVADNFKAHSIGIQLI